MDITMGDVDSIYGCFGKNYDYSVRLVVKMKDPVDGKILASAVRKAEIRFPYLSVRMRKNDSEYYFEDNQAPVVLLNTDRKISLNSEETNYHVWAVCYRDDRIMLDAYHGLMDGLGMFKLYSTILYYYCNERYGVTDHTGVRTMDDKMISAEWEDPQDFLPLPVSSGEEEEAAEAFSLTKDGGLPDDSPVNYDIELPEKAFVKYSSARDGSPGTMVALLMEHALDKWFPDRRKPIVCTYIINARPMLKAKETFHNCLYAAHFNYGEEMKKLPLMVQNTVARGITLFHTDEDKVKNDLAGKVQYCREILRDNPKIEDKNRAFAGMIDADARAQTCMVSYLGRWKYPATEGYVKELWPHVPAVNDLYIGMTAVGGKLCLSLQQVFDDDTFLKLFCNELRDIGISYQIRSKTKIDTAYFPRPE